MPEAPLRARDAGPRDLAGRLTGERPFERPWMAEYIDTVMAIDASKTRARTGLGAAGRASRSSAGSRSSSRTGARTRSTGTG